MIRAQTVHETFDCHECGALVQASEEYEDCVICGNPVHRGCAEPHEAEAGSGFACIGCIPTESYE